MPVFQLTEQLIFPHPSLAEADGLLAIGGDLSANRLFLAYQHGIFPWYNDDEPILWWSPDPRFVLFPKKLKVAKSMRSYFNQKKFRVTFNQAFSEVILQCKNVFRKDQDGTWITDEVESAYLELHRLGFMHSVEVWKAEKLVGGLYGGMFGKCFFGESMFAHEKNASKYGFISLVKTLEKFGIELIDAQVHTKHLENFGAEMIPKEQFLSFLENTSLRKDLIPKIQAEIDNVNLG